MSDEVDEADLKLVEACDYQTRLAVTAWVFKNVVDQAREGGSFRYLIYDRLGFGMDAYVPLYMAGGMTISNEFDLTRDEEVREVVRDKRIEELKPLLGMCDEPGCFVSASCGWPETAPEGESRYRHTCSAHSKHDK